MTQSEQRKIEKALIEGVNKEVVGTDAHKKALQELLDFQKTCEETRKNTSSEELEKQKAEIEAEKVEVEKQKIQNDLDKIEVERQKIESQETVAKCQRDLDEYKAKAELEAQEKHLKVEKMAARWNFIGSIITVLGSIAATFVGYKLFDKQATKAYKFEETGTISSFTSKQVLGGLKPPRK